MKKEHFEVLLENMTGKIDLVLEGHAVLNKKIDDNQRKNEEDHHFLQQMIQGVSQETKNLRNEFGDLRSEFGDLRSEFGDLRNEFGGLRSEFVDLRNEFVDFRKENETAHTALDKKMDTHKKEISDIKRRVSRLEAARA